MKVLAIGLPTAEAPAIFVARCDSWQRRRVVGAIEDDLLKLLPTAEQARDKIIQAKTQRLLAEKKRHEQEAGDKRALIQRLEKGSKVSDKQVLKRVIAIIHQAVTNGLTEVEVYRFPSALCADRGIAINNQSPGWEETLVGLPREMYEFWERHLRSRGYKFVCRVVDFPNGVLGDIAVSLKWS
jgi:hypothetical protein